MIKLNGRRGFALLVLAVFAATRGIAYLPSAIPEAPPGALQLISAHFPLAVWACLWLATGVLCAVYAFRRNDSIAWGALVGMMLGWGAAYFLGSLVSISMGQPSREWLTGFTYIGPAIAIAIISPRSGQAQEH